jgi:hypothetical protein
VPLAHGQALGIAIMSYDGKLGFGLLGDFDAMPDLDEMARQLEQAIADLLTAAGAKPPARKRKPRARKAAPAAG